MAKVRRNTRRHLHAAERRAREQAKAERGEESNFQYRHTDGMKKMLRGVDLERYESLAAAARR